MTIAASPPDLEETLRGLLGTDRVRLPPYPAVATRLQALISSDTHGARDLVKIVAADASLSATVLRLASSAALGAGKRVESLDAAVQKVGEREIVRLAFAQAVGQASAAPGPLASLRREQWRCGLISATLCQGLAQRRGLRPEVAFLAGLLHDFGKVVVLAGLEELAVTRKLPALPAAAWGEVVENLHVDFGTLIASRWRLPLPIADVLATHHHPEACLKQHRPLVDLVVLVDQVVAVLEQSSTHDADLLAAVPGLEPEERQRIATLLDDVAVTMASYETMFPPPSAKAEAASKVQREVAPPGSWPVDFAITIADRPTPLRACSLSPSEIGVLSKKAMATNSLTRITLECAPAPITMMVTVRSCEPTPGGEHLLSVKPFGLDGPAKPAWIRLLSTSRRGDSHAA